MSLRTDPVRTKQVAVLLYQAFQNQNVLGEIAMPEHILPRNTERGSHEHLHFITLTVAIDYQRDADKLWEASRLTFADTQTRYLYNPAAVAQTDFSKIARDMRKYRLSKKEEKDAQIWHSVCLTLTRHFDSDVYELLQSVNFNAQAALELIRDPRYNFLYLKGPKIGPLWLRMLEDSWQGHHLEALEKLPVPVDIHIATATVMTGGVTGPFTGSFTELREAVVQVWFDSCAGTTYYPLQFDEALWHLSRRGCRKTPTFPCHYRRLCPVARFCTAKRLTKENDWATIPR